MTIQLRRLKEKIDQFSMKKKEQKYLEILILLTVLLFLTKKLLLNLIKIIKPKIIFKGDDYSINEVVGHRKSKSGEVK